MTKKTKKRHQMTSSYSFNRVRELLPDSAIDKVKPPFTPGVEDSCAEKKQELSLDEQAQQYMDAYRKAERIIVINFYTGGGAYKKGILDAIYRGFNPMNP